MGPIRNPNWSTSGMKVTLSYILLLKHKAYVFILDFFCILEWHITYIVSYIIFHMRMYMCMIYQFLICFLCDVFILLTPRNSLLGGFFQWQIKINKNQTVPKIIDIQWNKGRNKVGSLQFVHDVTLFCHSFNVAHIPMIWRRDYVVGRRTARAKLRHSLINTVWWYHILYKTDYSL
jgi:hypothetical protein